MDHSICKYFDSTFLKTLEQSDCSESEYIDSLKSFILEAIEYKFKLVMIRQEHIELANTYVQENNSQLLVGTVIDFPLGQSTINQKEKEIQSAIELGADEIDIVLNYSLIKEKKWTYLKEEILRCTTLCLENKKITKWIIESAALSDQEIISVCQLIRDLVLGSFGPEQAKTVFVKSSTGYYQLPNGKSGGATVAAIQLMVSHSAPLPVKASGGVRNLTDFNKMLDAGVRRIGTSSALVILNDKKSNSDY